MIDNKVTTAAEIEERVKDSEEALSKLRDRMESDFDLFALTPYAADKGYESYTSSSPRNFFDKVKDGLNRARVSIQIKLPEDASEKERKAASKGEEYIYGALAAIDRRFRARGEPPLREQLAYYICLRGGDALRLLVREDKNKDTVFDAIVWDPLHVTYEWGPDGILWAASKRQLTRRQVMAEYPAIETVQGTKDIKLIDYWDDRDNAVVIDSKLAKPPSPHGKKKVPVYIGYVGSMPNVQRKNFESTVEFRGDSVWTASRNLYKPLNKYTSRTMDIYERAITGSLKLFSEDGTRTLDDDPHKTFQIIPLKRGTEDLDPLEPPKVPAETAILHSIIIEDLQQSTLPFPLAYGGTRQAMSGEALKQLKDATKSVYSPRTGALEETYRWICEELLTQFAEGTASEVKLNGYKPKAKGEGEQFFASEIKPGEINPEWQINVTVNPPTPRDKQEEIHMALAASQPRDASGRPLLPDTEIYENILKVQNPDAIIMKIREQVIERMIEQHPSVMLREMANALIEKKQPELAAEFLASMPPPPGQQQGAGQQPMAGQPQAPPAQAGPQPAPMLAQGVEGQPGAPPAEAILQQLMQLPPEEVARLVEEYQRGQAQQQAMGVMQAGGPPMAAPV